jgi:hypothetical protein
MSAERREEIRRMLESDERDQGCAAYFEIVEQAADIVIEGGDPDESFPGLTAHLHCCDGCRLDYEGLLEAARIYGDAAPAEADDPPPGDAAR